MESCGGFRAPELCYLQRKIKNELWQLTVVAVVGLWFVVVVVAEIIGGVVPGATLRLGTREEVPR